MLSRAKALPKFQHSHRGRRVSARMAENEDERRLMGGVPSLQKSASPKACSGAGPTGDRIWTQITKKSPYGAAKRLSRGVGTSTAPAQAYGSASWYSQYQARQDRLRPSTRLRRQPSMHRHDVDPRLFR